MPVRRAGIKPLHGTLRFRPATLRAPWRRCTRTTRPLRSCQVFGSCQPAGWSFHLSGV